METERTDILDIFLQPGDFYFGDAFTRIRTILGSCVAITMWHPRLREGGMCHFMLPERAGHLHPRHDGRYANDAVALFMRELMANRTHPSEYEVKLFGGGRMFNSATHRKAASNLDIGLRNIEAGRHLLRQHGFQVKAEHLAGNGHRNIIFDIASGDVWVKHVPELALNSGDRTNQQGDE